MISSGDRQKYKSAKWKILGRVVKFSKSFLFRIRSRYDSFHTRWETEVPSRTNVDRRFSSKIILFVFEKDRIGICSHTRTGKKFKYPSLSARVEPWSRVGSRRASKWGGRRLVRKGSGGVAASLREASVSSRTVNERRLCRCCSSSFLVHTPPSLRDLFSILHTGRVIGTVKYKVCDRFWCRRVLGSAQ